MDKNALENLGLTASNKFLTNHEDLNEVISKFAKEYNLNDEEIKRVVEISNNLTYMGILNSSQNRDVSFPVASLEKISNLLSFKTEVKKQASEFSIDYETMSEPPLDVSPLDAMIKEAVKIETENKNKEERDFLLDEYEMLKQAKEFVNQKLWDLNNRRDDLISKTANELLSAMCNKACTKDDIKKMLSTVSIKTAQDIATQVYQFVQDGDYAEVEGRVKALDKESAIPIVSHISWIDTTDKYNEGWKSVSNVIDNKIKALEEKGIKL